MSIFEVNYYIFIICGENYEIQSETEIQIHFCKDGVALLPVTHADRSWYHIKALHGRTQCHTQEPQLQSSSFDFIKILGF